MSLSTYRVATYVLCYILRAQDEYDTLPLANILGEKIDTETENQNIILELTRHGGRQEVKVGPFRLWAL